MIKMKKLEMNTLRGIKEYLKTLETETIVSARGNKYEVASVDEKLLNKICTFKSLYITCHVVKEVIIYSVVWFEKKERTEILVKEDK